MIYLDNGATTFPKPRGVVEEVNRALRFYSANPGRGGHSLAMRASEVLYKSRKNIADFFGVSNPSRVVFTHNCTTALNTVIKGVLHSGDHVVISSYEHNAVLRPLEKLKAIGVSYSVAEVAVGDNDKTIDNFRAALRPDTKLLVCTCASNVFGVRLPFERICALCHQYGILTCVDAAQGGGIIPIDLSESSVDFLCVAGHKGLYAPMGLGALIINCETIPDTLVEGGTGSNSESPEQPDILPDRFESGTLSLPAVAGLSAGVDFVRNRGVESLYRHELGLIQYAYSRLSEMKHIKLYTDYPEAPYFAPVLSFNMDERPSEEIAEALSSRYNIATRAGLHCAPLAHRTMGTIEMGTIRAVPSAFTTKKDINNLISAVYYLK